MPVVTKETPPQCRRFTYDGFDYVRHIIPTESLPGYSSLFTLRPRYNKSEKTVSCSEITMVFNEWIKRYSNKIKVCNKIIKKYKQISTTTTTYNAYFKQKKWIFGSNTTETKKNKQIYIDTHKALFVLCQNELMSINDDDDDDIDYVLSSSQKRLSCSLPQTPSLTQPPLATVPVSLPSTPMPTMTIDPQHTNDTNYNIQGHTIICPPSIMTQSITVSDGANINKTYVDIDGIMSIMVPALNKLMDSKFNEMKQSIQSVQSVLGDISDQIEDTKNQMYAYIRKENAKLKPPRSRSKKKPEAASDLTLARRRRHFERQLRSELDDKNVAAITNYCGNLNDNVKSMLVTADDGIAAAIKQMYAKQLKQQSNSGAALYQQCFTMIEQATSLRQHIQQRLLLTKQSDYAVNDDGVATLTRRKNKKGVVDTFGVATNFKRVLAHATELKWYRHGSQWDRFWTLNNGDGTDNEEYTLILFKPLKEIAQEMYYRCLTHPGFIGATTQPHYLYYKKYFDALIGIDVTGDDYKLYGDITPNMENYTITTTQNGDVLIQCKEMQLMAFGQDAKGNVIGLPTKKFYHGSVVPVTAMVPGAIQLRFTYILLTYNPKITLLFALILLLYLS